MLQGSRIRYYVLVPREWEILFENQFNELLEIINQNIVNHYETHGTIIGAKLQIGTTMGTLIVNNPYRFWWFRENHERGDYPPNFSHGYQVDDMVVPPSHRERTIIGRVQYRECVPRQLAEALNFNAEELIRFVKTKINEHIFRTGTPEITPINIGEFRGILEINHREKYWWYKSVLDQRTHPPRGRVWDARNQQQQQQPQEQQ